jgi:co-chaperonin GroES (HSP10)
MKIQPLGNNIQIELDKVEIGGLDTGSVESAVEYAKVVAIGTEVSPGYQEHNKFKVGHYVFVKAWAIDIISHNGEKFYFVNLDTQGVLAIVK